MKLTKPLLLLSAITLATASTTALADQSTEQVMGGVTIGCQPVITTLTVVSGLKTITL